MALDPVELLRQLIQIPSVNPMGRDNAGPHVGEERLTNFLQLQCAKLDLPWLRQRVHPGRDNLLALVRGNPPAQGGGELLLWDIHQDTVPVEGMTVDPFGGEVRDGRVYGRGACDVKGSMAAMLVAVSRLNFADKSSNNRPTVVIAFTINEECGFTGASSLTHLWQNAPIPPAIIAGTISPLEMFPRPPDAAIVAEPTGLNVVVAHLGVIRWRCHTIGRAAHTSRPDLGINAIYAMAQVVQAIERYHRELQKSAAAHALCGRSSVCVSTIHGGVGVNTVPERATIEIDRRLRPGESPHDVYDHLVRYIADHAHLGGCRIEHDPLFMDGNGLSDETNQALAQRLASLVGNHGHQSDLVGVPYATDAAAIAAGGIPSVVFGPGSIDQAHTADEFIEIDELNLATEILFEVAHHGLKTTLSS
jgi:acetylornithine deacetylase/succinyl-diaminopimelate desuccinylase-like protein